jgi:hypothetical protein
MPERSGVQPRRVWLPTRDARVRRALREHHERCLELRRVRQHVRRGQELHFRALHLPGGCARLRRYVHVRLE